MRLAEATLVSLATLGRRRAPQVVAVSRAPDLDDFCPHVGEHQRAVWPGDNLRQVRTRTPWSGGSDGARGGVSAIHTRCIPACGYEAARAADDDFLALLVFDPDVAMQPHSTLGLLPARDHAARRA